MKLSTRPSWFSTMRRSNRLLRARQPHVASAHMISYPIPTTAEPIFTRRYIALLIVVGVLVTAINVLHEPAATSCTSSAVSK